VLTIIVTKEMCSNHIANCGEHLIEFVTLDAAQWSLEKMSDCGNGNTLALQHAVFREPRLTVAWEENAIWFRFSFAQPL
jgi:hypothetical protein